MGNRGPEEHLVGTEVYHPVEHAILAKYFAVTPLVPTRGIDVTAGAGESKPYVSLERDLCDKFGEFALANAVARLVLHEVQGRLPQWASARPDGTVTLARQDFPETRRALTVSPEHLFSINWANSLPGISWPEAYDLAYVPLYDRWVVTTSRDGPDVHGYADHAIGHYAATDDRERRECIGAVVRGWWDSLCRIYDQPRWEHFCLDGLIDERTVDVWAREVWKDHERSPDDCDTPWKILGEYYRRHRPRA